MDYKLDCGMSVREIYEFNKTIIMRHHREAQVSILDSIIKESTL